MKRFVTRHFAAFSLAALVVTAAPTSSTFAAALTYTLLPLINSWTYDGDTTRKPSAALDAENVVHLRGAMRLTSGSSQEPFVLPVKFRPNKIVYIGVSLINGKPGRLNIFPSGIVAIQAAYNTVDAFNFTSLEGVTFSKN